MDHLHVLSQSVAVRVLLGHVPTWWEGESLYGWCSRLHALTGGKTSAFELTLFGRPHASGAVDIPAGLERFVVATEGMLGGVEEILTTRTVVAVYWPFADEHTRARVLAAVTDSFGVSVAQVLGLSTSRMGARHPLRSCPDCRREAYVDNGYATWFLRHQLPGVWWCPVHRRPLEQARTKRALWRKPGNKEAALGAPATPEEQHALELVQSLAYAIAEIKHAHLACLTIACLGRLRVLNLASSSTRLNVSRLTQWLDRQPILQWIRRQGRLVSFPAGNWAVPMLRGRCRQDPLKWMVLWACLWNQDSPECAVDAFKNVANGLLTSVDISEQLPLWQEDLWQRKGEAIPNVVAVAFRSNNTLKGVAQELGVSIGAVQALLRERPDFTQIWFKAVRKRQIRAAMSRMLHALEVYPGITRSELLLRCKQDSTWLGVNAPRTLSRFLDRIPDQGNEQGDLF
jgi:hypothetical protein